MKITILSHDLYGFNAHIAQHLLTLGHEVTYISTTDFHFEYRSLWHKTSNALSKTLLNKNSKKTALHLYIKEIIQNSGEQNITLVVDPAHFTKDILKTVRAHSKKMIAYNYDSTAILEIPKGFCSFFDQVFSFDKQDCATYGFTFITNYNYFKRQAPLPTYPLKAFTIQSLSQDRIHTLNKIGLAFHQLHFTPFLFIIYGKPYSEALSEMEFRKSRTNFEEIKKHFEEAEIIIDLVRDHQTGLSFRFFEAMAYQKKLITTNADVATYDFYDPNNILIVDRENPEIPDSFLRSQYVPLPESIYNKYTLETWVNTVFSLSSPN